MFDSVMSSLSTTFFFFQIQNAFGNTCVEWSVPGNATQSAVAGFAIQCVGTCAAECALGFLDKAE